MDQQGFVEQQIDPPEVVSAYNPWNDRFACDRDDYPPVHNVAPSPVDPEIAAMRQADLAAAARQLAHHYPRAFG